MKKLLLHACCAPCSSSVIEKVDVKAYDTKLYYYNPNIRPVAEYERRLAEMDLLTASTIEGERDFNDWNRTVGIFPFKEGGNRCTACFYHRLSRTARFAKANGFNLFATTLTVSPHKNAEVINAIGEKVAVENDIAYLPSNFKKQGGYQRSLELSKQLGMYRQDYCGCTPRTTYKTSKE